MKIDYRAIGQRIKQKRKDASQTQDMLAEKMGVSVGYISQLERGVTKINLDTLARISDVLHCELTELITGVTPVQEDYMLCELSNTIQSLDDRQRRLLLEIALAIKKYKK